MVKKGLRGKSILIEKTREPKNGVYSGFPQSLLSPTFGFTINPSALFFKSVPYLLQLQ